MNFVWNEIKHRPDGKVLLLYRHERIFEEGLVSPGMSAVDVGGWGVLAARLRQEGVGCTIVDYFTEDQYYPDRVRASDFLEADICVWEDVALLAPVNLVSCFEMLEHCWNQPAAIQNMYRLLAPNGWLVGTFPLPDRVHAADDPTLTFLSKEDLNLLLTNAGFCRIIIEPTASINKDDPPCSLYFRAQRLV